LFDASVSQEGAEAVGAEVSAVVGLEDEGRAEEAKEIVEHTLESFGGGFADGEPGQGVAAGEVADGEQIRVDAVDGRQGSWCAAEGRLGEVHGPDTAGDLPLQDVEEFGVPLSVDMAIADDEVGEFGASEVWEFLAERRYTGGRTLLAKIFEAADDDVALIDGGLLGWPAEGNGFRRGVGVLVDPMTERASSRTCDASSSLADSVTCSCKRTSIWEAQFLPDSGDHCAHMIA
jgi:hypothetical protein